VPVALNLCGKKRYHSEGKSLYMPQRSNRGKKKHLRRGKKEDKTGAWNTSQTQGTGTTRKKSKKHKNGVDPLVKGFKKTTVGTQRHLGNAVLENKRGKSKGRGEKKSVKGRAGTRNLKKGKKNEEEWQQKKKKGTLFLRVAGRQVIITGGK